MTKQGGTEPEPVEAEQEVQDILEMDPDALAAEIDRRASGEDVAPEPVADEVEAEEPEPLDAAEAEASDETDESEETVEAEPEDDSDPVAARLSALEQRLEAEALQREQQEAKNEHLRFMLDRKSGEIGHLKNQLRQAEQTHTTDEDGYEPEPRQPQRSPVNDELKSELEQLRTERVARAAQETYLQLQQDNAQFWEAVGKRDPSEAEEFQKSWNDKFQKELVDLDAASAVSDGDAKRVSSILRAAYKSALANARLEWLNRGNKGRKTSADQSAKLKERKLAATAGATGARPKPRPRLKALEELDADEIKKEIDRRSAAGL